MSKQFYVGCELQANTAMMLNGETEVENDGRSARHVITTENKIWTCPKWNASTCSFIQSISISYIVIIMSPPASQVSSQHWSASSLCHLIMHFIVYTFLKPSNVGGYKNKPHLPHILLPFSLIANIASFMHLEIARFFKYIHIRKNRSASFCFLFILHPLKGTKQSMKTNKQPIYD